MVEIGLALSRIRDSKSPVLLVLLRDVVIPEPLREFRYLDAKLMTGDDIAAEICDVTWNVGAPICPQQPIRRRPESTHGRHRFGREDSRTGRSADAIRRDFLGNLFCLQARFPAIATKNDQYMALAYTVRDRLLKRWINTSSTYHAGKVRTVCYMSAEFLPGPHLGNALINLDIWEPTRQAMAELGIQLEELLEQEQEPGLGSGGLGRPRCLLSRFPVDPADSGHRLWHPVRVRHFRAGDQVRLAGGARRQLAPIRQSLGDRAPRACVRGQARRAHRGQVRCRRTIPRELGAGQRDPGRRVRHADPGLRGGHGEPAASLESGGLRVVRPAGVQPWRLLRRGKQQDRLGNDLESAVSERRTRGGQGAATAAAVFLRLVLAARHAAHLLPGRERDRATSPTSMPSSSTTRTPPSRWSN